VGDGSAEQQLLAQEQQRLRDTLAQFQSRIPTAAEEPAEAPTGSAVLKVARPWYKQPLATGAFCLGTWLLFLMQVWALYRQGCPCHCGQHALPCSALQWQPALSALLSPPNSVLEVVFRLVAVLFIIPDTPVGVLWRLVRAGVPALLPPV
jgi:hypothetical protein